MATTVEQDVLTFDALLGLDKPPLRGAVDPIRLAAEREAKARRAQDAQASSLPSIIIVG